MVTGGLCNLYDFCQHDFQTGQKDTSRLDPILLQLHIEQIQQNTLLHLTRVQTTEVLMRQYIHIRAYVISVNRHIAHIGLYTNSI